MNGPGMDGAPPSSTEARLAAVSQERISLAKIRLSNARKTRREADLTGDVTEEMLEEIVVAEESLENLLLK